MEFLRPMVRKGVFGESFRSLDLSTDETIFRYLVSQGFTPDQIVEKVAEYYSIPAIEIKSYPVDLSLESIFNFTTFKEMRVLPLKRDTAGYHFAIADYFDEQTKNTISNLCRQREVGASFYFAFDFAILDKFQELAEIKASMGSEEDAISWVDKFLTEGIRMNASDIHLEPHEGYLQIRYRIDGVLAAKRQFSVTQEFWQNISTRIKVMAGMDITEKRRPQDGRIKDFKAGGRTLDLRVSSVTTVLGEKFVFRLFDTTTEILTYEQLGFLPEQAKAIESLLSSPYGVIYLAGATGSGKTTTLYSMIDQINSDEINIYTVEDPVEKTIPNVNQIRIDPLAGIDYPSTMRSLLRQDPDVIAIGEVRDPDTAALSVEASLTGHLVLATIHANNAFDTLNRLYNMGVDPYLLSASLLGLVSQRLVRVLCPHCKALVANGIREKHWLELMQEKYPDIAVREEEIYSPVGCPKCNNTGYKGRTVIAEAAIITPELREMIAQKTPVVRMLELAKKSGFKPLEYTALLKVAKGITSVSEALRVNLDQ